MTRCRTSGLTRPQPSSGLASRHYWHLRIKNALRPSCVGKKNYLFFGHPDAGWRSAVIYSVIVSCRRRKIDPWEYLRDLMRRLPAAKNLEILSLVPARWKPKDPVQAS